VIIPLLKKWDKNLFS